MRNLRQLILKSLKSSLSLQKILFVYFERLRNLNSFKVYSTFTRNVVLSEKNSSKLPKIRDSRNRFSCRILKIATNCASLRAYSSHKKNISPFSLTSHANIFDLQRYYALVIPKASALSHDNKNTIPLATHKSRTRIFRDFTR